jgi:3-hydroxyisobutyrate dehydrogenase
LRYLDCPVTGLPDAAAAGRLTLLVGASADDLEAAGPVLAPLADEVLRFGPVGAGTAYKLIVNLMGAVQIAGAAEGLALAERAGLDLQQVASALASSQAASPQVVRNSRRMVDANSDVVFSGRLRRKDTAYAIRLAERLGMGVPFGEVALDGLDALLAAGLGEANESAIIEVARARRRQPQE